MKSTLPAFSSLAIGLAAAFTARNASAQELPVEVIAVQPTQPAGTNVIRSPTFAVEAHCSIQIQPYQLNPQTGAREPLDPSRFRLRSIDRTVRTREVGGQWSVESNSEGSATVQYELFDTMTGAVLARDVAAMQCRPAGGEQAAPAAPPQPTVVYVPVVVPVYMPAYMPVYMRARPRPQREFIRRSRAAISVGAPLVGVSVLLGLYGAVFVSMGCYRDYYSSYSNCSNRDLGYGFLGVSAVVGTIGSVLLGYGATKIRNPRFLLPDVTTVGIAPTDDGRGAIAGIGGRF